jgi:hypothetical protein
MSRLKHVDWAVKEDKVLLLQQLWQLLQPQLPHAAARHCAEAMLTASKLGVCPEGLYEACLLQFVAQVGECCANQDRSMVLVTQYMCGAPVIG